MIRSLFRLLSRSLLMSIALGGVFSASLWAQSGVPTIVEVSPGGADTGVDIGAGESVSVSASGEWLHFSPLDYGADGETGEWGTQIAPCSFVSAAYGALIGSLDGGSTWFFVGSGPTTVAGPGHLLLRANDCPDNPFGPYDIIGSLTVTVTPLTLPSLSINDVTAMEGNSGTANAVFTVSLSAASDQWVTVDYATADGTGPAAAMAGSDYEAIAGTLTFAPGEVTKNIALVNGDVTLEPNEMFFVYLTNPTNATISGGRGVGTILNDDPLPTKTTNETFLAYLINQMNATIPGGRGVGTTLTLSINDVAAMEGNSGTANAVFTVSLSAASDQWVTVDYATADGTGPAAAMAGSDYEAIAGTLAFAPGEVTKNIAVPVNGDVTLEPNETFFVNLTNPTNATISGGRGVGTILNDDPLPTKTTVVSSVNPSVFGQPVTVTATVSSSASTPTGNVTFSDGGTDLGTVALDVSGQASIRTDALSAGNHNITGIYGGDGDFETSASEVLTLTVLDPNQPPTKNQPPVAIALAYPSTTVNVGESVTLDGFKSYDPDGDKLTFYIWQIGGVEIGTGYKIVWSPPAAGTYTVTLWVGDGQLKSSADVVITVIDPKQPPVGNQPPVADAGPDQTVAFGTPVTLDGSQSYDPDGDKLFFAWLVDGDQIAQGPEPTLLWSPNAVGTYTVTLVISDGKVKTSADVVITVVDSKQPPPPPTKNQPPVADAGADQDVLAKGELVLVGLDGSGSSDPDVGDQLSYRWSEGDVTLVEWNTEPTAHVELAVGDHTITLMVDDGHKAIAQDDVLIRVRPLKKLPPKNNPPVADAGPDQTVECTGAQTNVTLNGADSSDPDTDALSYSWSENGAEISMEVSPTLSLTKGSHTFTLTVSDGKGGDASDQVAINVADTTPPSIALNGGGEITVECHLGTYEELGATASDVCDGDLSAAIVITGSVTVDVVNDYTLTYTVADEAGHSAAITRIVHVVDTTPPVAQASLSHVRGHRGDDDDDDDEGSRGNYYRVSLSAADACDTAPAITAYIAQPLTAANSITVSYKRERKNRIEIKQDKKGIRVKLEGPSQAALRSLLDQALATGGFAVTDGQVVKLVPTRQGRRDDDEKGDYQYKFDGSLKLTSAKGPGIKLVAFATDDSGNRSAVVEMAPSRPGLAKMVAESASLPSAAGLAQNYPNPFNPSTTIGYTLAEAGAVRLTIFNMMGQQVMVLVDEAQGPGTYQVEWDGRDGAGQQVANGLYLYRLEAGDQLQVKKMLFAK